MEKYEILHVVNYPNNRTTRTTISAQTEEEIRMLFEREIGKALICASRSEHITTAMQFAGVGMIHIKSGALSHTFHLFERINVNKRRVNLTLFFQNNN